MNINDVKNPDVITGDKLESIFARQNELERKYRPIEEMNSNCKLPSIPLNVDSFEGQKRCRDLIYRITEELYEAGNCLRNKAWKNSQVATDKDHFVEELADALHFYIQLMIELGFTAEDLQNLYFKKSQVNLFRQRSNY